jgi:catalase
MGADRAPCAAELWHPGLYGVNAFKFTNAQKQSVFIRYQIIPEAGEHALAGGVKPGPAI